MIGYDAGARLEPGDVPGLFSDAATPPLETESGSDGDAASDVLEHAEALNEVARVVGRMHGATATHEEVGVDRMPVSAGSPFDFAAFEPDGERNQVMHEDGQSSAAAWVPPDPDLGRILTPVTMALEQDPADQMIGETDRGVAPLWSGPLTSGSAFENDDASLVNAVSAISWPDPQGVAEEVFEGSPAGHEESGEKGDQVLEPIMRAAAVPGSAYPKYNEHGDNIEALGDLANRRAQPQGDTDFEEQDGAGSVAYNIEPSEVEPEDEPEADLHNVEKAFPSNRMERYAGRQDFDEAAPNIADRTKAPRMKSPWSLNDTSLQKTMDLPGLWGMLKDAERGLPKPGFEGDEGSSKSIAPWIGDEPDLTFGEPVKPLASSITGPWQKTWDEPAETIKPEAGRVGPTGHRNDPIYTIAIGSGGGTLMPMVPTPGTSTRSPPIPGQRNLA